MISLPELRARNVTPIWQEAVAVVQELIQTVKATTGSAEFLPDLEHVSLIPNGDVVALPGSPQPAVPVRHAAVLLRLLVDGVPAPPELEQFIARNVAEPPQYDTVAEFSRNLAFFERPGRRSDVERLVSRAAAAEQSSRADEELRKLKERAAEVAPEVPPPDFLQQSTRKVKTVPIAAVAAAGVVVIAGALWLWQRASAPQAPAATQATGSETAAADAATAPAGQAASAETVAAPEPNPAASPATPATGDAAAAVPDTAAPAPAKSFFARAIDGISSAVRSLFGRDSEPAAAPPATASADPAAEPAAEAGAAPATTAAAQTSGKDVALPATPPRRRTAAAKSDAAAVAAAPAPAAPAPADTPAFVPLAVEAAPAYPAATVDRAVEEPVLIFTAADTSVTPAVIVRPVLPKDPPPNVPPEQIGTIDVWVDERGDVMRVKLISPANRFHERMLVSAAKMWKFRPAYKDGRPVRYITRVRLTI